MRTNTNSPSRSARRVAGLSVALAGLVLAAPAMAIPNFDPHNPIGDGGIFEPPIFNIKPTARLTATPALPLLGSAITLNAAGSFDPDGSIAKYEWDLDRNGTFETISTSATQTVVANTVGPRSYTVRVRDNEGATDTATDAVRVTKAPTAAIAASLPAVVTGQQVTFSGAGSTDEGTIVKYEWDLDGNGSFETGTAGVPTVTTSFTTPGAPQVRLRVTDQDNLTGTATTSIAVVAAPVVETADLTGPVMRVLTSRAKATGGAVRVRVACPASETVCRLKVTLRGINSPLAGRSLGVSRTTLAGGESALVRIALAKPAKKTLVKRGSLAARVVVQASDAAGNSSFSTARMKITRR
jgi:hypothetical protein